MRKAMIAGLFLVCCIGNAFAAGPPLAVLDARQAVQNTVPEDRAEIRGLRQAVRAGKLSPVEAHQLIQQIKAQMKALRRR